MKKLIDGIIKFRETSIEDYRNKFSKLASEQKPDALMVACCDSRVVPNTFASSNPGDLFVLRNIGNLIPVYSDEQVGNPSVLSAIEYSVGVLGVTDIIVCGHSECGAMEAMMECKCGNGASSPAVTAWLGNADSSYDRFKQEALTDADTLSDVNRLSRVNVLQQLDNLKTYPLVKEKLNSKQLQIHGWWFDLAAADIYYYNECHQKFCLIDSEATIDLTHSLA